jgi:hypothetical protein
MISSPVAKNVSFPTDCEKSVVLKLQPILKNDTLGVKSRKIFDKSNLHLENFQQVN